MTAADGRLPIFEDLVAQPRVASFLSSAVSSGRVSHAYLFLGRPGSEKTTAAYDFAAALLCKSHGCGSCDECIRVRRHSHPDVHYYAPAGVNAYVVDQIREIVRDVNLAPIRASRKVYIIDRVDLLQGTSANALLKTLEEPPAGVVFILLGRTRTAILPTILSRCQVVPFRTIPEDQAAQILQESTGATKEDALIALAASASSIARAKDYLLSPSRKQVRDVMLTVLDGLIAADDLDVLNGARDIIAALKEPIGEVKAAQTAELELSSDYLSKSLLRDLEDRQKRELGAREKQNISELFSLVESWLRDCLLVCAGLSDTVTNTDDYAAIERVALTTDVASATRAIGIVHDAAAFITYNVTPQLVIENMLFDIREVIRCPQS